MRCSAPLESQLERNLFSSPKIRVEDFEAVAMPHFADLYRTAKWLAQRSGEAEDLVQEVYLEAWKSYHRFTAGTNCRAWLFKIMFHRLHHFRRRWIKASKVDAFEGMEQENIASPAAVPENIQDEEILLALEQLPVDFREVVLLADVQEFSYKEVAEIMQIPVGTVMSRLSRARRLLRQALSGVAAAYGIRVDDTERAAGGESA
jgi:RNA polymerase sigma-70 factor, ECF subfamily